MCNVILDLQFFVDSKVWEPRMIRYIGLASSAVILVCMPVIAQDVATTTETYTLADFAQYAPRTALDMVRQIPGFAIQRDNDGFLPHIHRDHGWHRPR